MTKVARSKSKSKSKPKPKAKAKAKPTAKSKPKAAPVESRPVTLKVASVHAPDPKAGYIGSIAVAGSTVYGAGGNWGKATILRSLDGGRSFESITPPESQGLRDIHVEGDRVYVVGENGIVATTIDGGATWDSTTVGRGACLYAIERERTKAGAPGMLWLTGDGGLVMRTKTGKKWRAVPTKTTGRVLQLYFDPQERVPWLLDSGGELQRWTKDAFAVVPVNAMRANRPLTCLQRTHTGALLLIGDGGMVLRSTTNGATWTKIVVGTRADLEDLIVTLYGILIVGDNGTLLVSNDDGKSWDPITTAMTGHLWSLAAIDSGLLVGGAQGALYRIERSELATLLRDAYAGHDDILAGLASRVHDSEPGAEMVLEDAMRERGLLSW